MRIPPEKDALHGEEVSTFSRVFLFCTANFSSIVPRMTLESFSKSSSPPSNFMFSREITVTSSLTFDVSSVKLIVWPMKLSLMVGRSGQGRAANSRLQLEKVSTPAALVLTSHWARRH